MPNPVNYHLGKFVPTHDDFRWPELIPLIGPANAALARYDGLLGAIPNPQVLLSPLTTQEAVLSSKIEGTHVTMSEVLQLEAGGDGLTMTQERRDDAEEIINYRRAMRMCVDEMATRPFSQQMLRSAHYELLQGVRGKDMNPGSYRTEQNWIGPKGCRIEEASFVPISPEHLESGMDQWAAYFRETHVVDPLIQLGLLHVEFEALHPFKDGNGRLGRMILPLFLHQRRLLSSPTFYMSAYLEANREDYQERLREVSRTNDWTGWTAFFLKGVTQQAGENERKARQILSLYEKIKHKVTDLTHSQYSIRAVDYIFCNPIFRSPSFVTHSAIPKPTASRILSLLRDEGILTTLRAGRGRRSGVFAFSELLNVAEGRAVF